MPIMHMKTPKANHGGEDCMACGGGVCKLAGGGAVKGVHERAGPDHLKGGMSHAGSDYRISQNPAVKNHPVGKATLEDAKEMHREKLGELKTMPNPKIKGLAEGGEVDSDGDEDGDMESEIHDMLGSELMDAIHKKDHKALMSGIEAAVLSCMNKKGKIK